MAHYSDGRFRCGYKEWSGPKEIFWAPIRGHVYGDWRKVAQEADTISLVKVNAERADYNHLLRLGICSTFEAVPIQGTASRLRHLAIDYITPIPRDRPAVYAPELYIPRFFDGFHMPLLSHLTFHHVNCASWDFEAFFGVACAKCPKLTHVEILFNSSFYARSFSYNTVKASLHRLSCLEHLALPGMTANTPELVSVILEFPKIASLDIAFHSGLEQSTNPVWIDDSAVSPGAIQTLTDLRLSGSVQSSREVWIFLKAMDMSKLTRFSCNVSVGADGGEFHYHHGCRDLGRAVNLKWLELGIDLLQILKFEFNTITFPELHGFRLLGRIQEMGQFLLDSIVWLMKQAPSLITVDLTAACGWKMEHLERIRVECPDLPARLVILGGVPVDVVTHEVANPRQLLRLFTFANGREFWQEPPVKEEEPVDPELRLFE